ncbi:MAG: T9SS type A sorting domain-containing protein [Saprospiraceae bacterium]
MKKLFILIFNILIFFPLVTAQKTMPGGVAGLKIWYLSAEKPDGEVYWESRVGGESVFSKGTALGRHMNFNLAFLLEASNNELSFPFEASQFQQASFFSVFHPADSFLERSVWSYPYAAGKHLVLTTHRMADLGNAKFINFLDTPKGMPTINAYYQYLPSTQKAASPSNFLIGGKPAIPDLPIAAFEGTMPEFLVYDRVLTADEQLKISSYLAIKYGLSLQKSDYLAADGQVLWNAKANAVFSNRITGLGRDDTSGLYQKQSTNQSTSKPLLTIGVEAIAATNQDNSGQIPNQSFLLWGDNNGSLSPEEAKEASNSRLARKWLMQASGSGQQLSTQLQFDSDQLEDFLKTDEVLWLWVDRSGKGTYALGEVDVFKGEGSHQKGVFHFNDIHWDTDGSGTDVFSFSVGPDMIAKTWVTSPTCHPATAGEIHVGIAGGEPPYSGRIQSVSNNYYMEWSATSDKLHTFSSLVAGEYQLTVIDAKQHTYTANILLQSKDAPFSQLAKRYALKENTPLVLDAALGMPPGIAYLWTTPDGQPIHQPKIVIEREGWYQLNLDLAGCAAQQLIKIDEAEGHPFKAIHLYPNPIRVGEEFQIRISLHQSNPVQVNIIDASGRTIKQQQFKGAAYYRFSSVLPSTGQYHVQFQSGHSSTALSLIVQ